MSVFNNKKIHNLVAGVMALSVMLPSLAFADTTSISTLIAQLQSQIAALNAQMTTLKAAQTQVQTAHQSVNATVEQLRSQIQCGANGDDVATLQTVLASDPSIFPEGIINGIYGKKTSEAVKRFQKLTGLTPTGCVGPQTLNALNQFLKRNPIIVQDGNVCALVLNGQKPKGWERKLDRERGNHGMTAIPTCTGGIPQSILNLFGVSVTASTTPTTGDTTAPVVFSITSSSITTSGATITWTSNENATTQVDYGTTNSYGNSTSFNASLVTGHSVALTGLASNTTYHFRVDSKDASNNLTASGDMTFTTSSADTGAPVLSSIVAGSLTTTGATITWTTNESATTQVDYGTTSSYGNSTTLDTTLLTSHTVVLSALTPSTTYHFRVDSKDASNNLASSGDVTFTTPSPVDVTAPVISSSAVSAIGSTVATLSWNTDEAATGKVYFNSGNSFDLNSALSSSNGSLVTGHSFGLTGLAASTTYSYVLVSADVLGNTATTSAATFATTN